MQSLRRMPPPATAQQLSDDLGVSLRTIYRDIESLRGLGAVIDGEAGFGYTLIEDAALPPLGFDNEELEALVLGLRNVEVVGDSALSKAGIICIGKNSGAGSGATSPPPEARGSGRPSIQTTRADSH